MVLLNEDRVGVRAAARFAARYRAEGCPVGKEVRPEEKLNAKWRRITGITEAVEDCMDVKERRAGIRDLIRYMQEFVKKDMRSAREGLVRFRSGVPSFLDEGDVRSGVNRIRGFIDETQTAGKGSDRGKFETCATCDDAGNGTDNNCDDGENGANNDAPENGVNNAPADNYHDDEVWACEGQSAELILKICRDLNLTRNKLTELVKEVRGISATELIDGFRVGAVKRLLAERMRAHARELWMAPGLYVGILVLDERLTLLSGGKSGYFVEPDKTWIRKELGDSRQERRAALIQEYDAGWRRGDQSRDGFAVALGFRNFSELNRACLNVFGKSARQVAYAAACDIVEYYLAKEMEELRLLASGDPNSGRVARARFLYSGGEAPGQAESLLWATQDAAWREGMGRWLE